MNYLSFIPNYINNLIIAALVVLAAFIIGRVAEKIITRVVKELELSYIMNKATNLRFSLENIAGQIVKWTIALIGIMSALRYLGIQNFILNFLIILITFILGISLLLSANDWIPNMFYGFKNKKKENQILKIKNLEGIIEKRHLTHILLKTKTGDYYRIPYSAVKN